MEIYKLWFILLISFLVSSCKGADHSSSPLGSARKLEGIKANREVMVPATLVKEIEDWYLKSRRKSEPDLIGSDAEVMSELKRQLLNLTLVMRPKSGDALSEQVDFQLPTGGGQIDMAEVLTGDRGGFWLQMGISEPPADSQLRAFFISAGRKRELSDAVYGSGCDQWFEITSWYQKHISGDPLELYATDQRHVSVMAGTWLVALQTGPQLWLGTLSFSDSRYPVLQCHN